MVLLYLNLFLFTMVDTDLYRFYNPQNSLWATALFIQDDSPYNVVQSDPFWMTARRFQEDAGAVTIIQGGGGGSGTAGVNGNSVTYIYRAFARGTNPVPTWTSTAPTGGSYSFTTGPTSFIAPNDWHLNCCWR